MSNACGSGVVEHWTLYFSSALWIMPQSSSKIHVVTFSFESDRCATCGRGARGVTWTVLAATLGPRLSLAVFEFGGSARRSLRRRCLCEL